MTAARVRQVCWVLVMLLSCSCEHDDAPRDTTVRRPQWRSASWPGLLGDEEVAVETEEVLASTTEIFEVGLPGIGLLWADGVVSRGVGSDHLRHTVAVGAGVVLGVEHRNHLLVDDFETSLAQLGYQNRRQATVLVRGPWIQGTHGAVSASNLR